MALFCKRHSTAWEGKLCNQARLENLRCGGSCYFCAFVFIQSIRKTPLRTMVYGKAYSNS